MKTKKTKNLFTRTRMRLKRNKKKGHLHLTLTTDYCFEVPNLYCRAGTLL